MSELNPKPTRKRKAPPATDAKAPAVKLNGTNMEAPSATPSPAPATPTATQTVTTSPAPAAPAALATPPPPPEKTLSQIFSDFLTLIYDENPLGKKKELCECVNKIVVGAMKRNHAYPNYNWLIIYDPVTMVRSDIDNIYKAINSFKTKSDIGLIVNSGGGHIEPAYLISKLCRESSKRKFVAVVPRRAKSAATLLCCGADEIHMGQLSELGPIYPQFNDLPALGLKNAVQHVAELASQYPKAAEMFAKYLSSSLSLANLGYYERVAESAVQYAERLLKKRITPLNGNPQKVATQLVYGYKDHGFVIDSAEAESIFGAAMIKGGTSEYDLANSVYEWLSLIESTSKSAGYGFYMYGHPESEPSFYKLDKK